MTPIQNLKQRLVQLGHPAATDLVKNFEQGVLPTATFFQEAASLLKGMTQSEAGNRFSKNLERFASSAGIHLPPSIYNSIFSNPDRGARVAAVENWIRQGLINPQEVLHA